MNPIEQIFLIFCLLPVTWWALRFQHRASVETARPAIVAPTLPSPERPRLEIVSTVPRAELALRRDAAKDAPRADLRGLAEYDAQRHSNGAAE